ncbi:MAG: hypothetical protein O3B68_22120 [Planctomycetota bacterium]|nr:hypothetical protein [Planctomycetota bacterium]
MQAKCSLAFDAAFKDRDLDRAADFRLLIGHPCRGPQQLDIRRRAIHLAALQNQVLPGERINLRPSDVS